MSDETRRVLGTAGGSDRPDWPATESAIRQLAVNYALGTDAIGRDERETGRALYHQTFTPDADISIAGALDTQRTGPDEWVGFVEDNFRGAGHIATQHLIGSTNIVPSEDGESAEMSTYMHASHLGPTGDVLVVLLTYIDQAVRTEEGWRIACRTLYPMASWMQPAPSA